MLILIDRFKQNVYPNKKFLVPDKVNAFTNEYFNDNDAVDQFVNQCIEIAQKVKDKIERKDLYTEFVEFTKFEGHDPMKCKEFYQIMIEKRI